MTLIRYFLKNLVKFQSKEVSYVVQDTLYHNAQYGMPVLYLVLYITIHR